MDNITRIKIPASEVREVMMGRGYEDYIITSIEMTCRNHQIPPEAYIWGHKKK